MTRPIQKREKIANCELRIADLRMPVRSYENRIRNPKSAIRNLIDYKALLKVLLSTLVILPVMSTVACRKANDNRSGDASNSATVSEGSSNPAKGEQRVERRVKRLIAEELGLEEDEVGLDTNLADDLDADELDRVSVVMRLEEEFDLEIPDEEVEKLKTVRDVCEYIKQHKK